MEQNTNSESRDHSDTAFPFTPVRLRYRDDGWTPDRQHRYAVLLAATGHAGKAARGVGMTEQSAARLRRRSDAAEFRRACELAVQSARRRWAMARLAASSRKYAERFGFSDPQAS